MCGVIMDFEEVEDKIGKFDKKWEGKEYDGPDYTEQYNRLIATDSDLPIICYTDGSCNSKTKFGGYGLTMFVETKEGNRIEFLNVVHSDPVTTISKMELGAAIHALRLCDMFFKGRAIHIHSDSEYVVKGVNERIEKWVNFNGKKANQEMWVNLLPLLNKVPNIFSWVKGHSGDAGNERADRLAGRGYQHAMKYKEIKTVISRPYSKYLKGNKK